MASTPPKITLHMVSSLDGFISKPDGDVSWMHSTDVFPAGKSLSEEEITDFLVGIDCYVMGAGTYDHALELGWPYGDTPVIVLSHGARSSERDSVSFFAGEPADLVSAQLQGHENVWLVGGAQVAKAFLRAQLVDEIVVSMMPVLLGGGTLFFDYIGIEQRLHLKDVTAYNDGMVEMQYTLQKAD